jgi:glutamate carboxypeptidase
MDLATWIQKEAAGAEAQMKADLRLLVSISTPSGDVAGGSLITRAVCKTAGRVSHIEYLPSSTEGFPDDLEITQRGTGEKKLLLLGHLDTVFPHERHWQLEERKDRWCGPGVIDMKGGVAIALAVLRALKHMKAAYSELVLLLVADEEWRAHPLRHTERYRDFDACLCFEAGRTMEDGTETVVTRRKAVATIRIARSGVSGHAADAFEQNGTNAIFDLVSMVLNLNEKNKQRRGMLSVVPTILRVGEAVNVVPGEGELFCDVRAEDLQTIEDFFTEVVEPGAKGPTFACSLYRRWRGMDTWEASVATLDKAGEILGRPIATMAVNGASDASHIATVVPLTIDGLGPTGGDEHGQDEWLEPESLVRRLRVALACVATILPLDA